MGTVFNLTDKIELLDAKEIIVKSLEQTKDKMPDIVRSQLHYGEDGTGHQISPKYREEGYAIAKEEMNPVPGLGTPDLFLTGDFTSEIIEDVDASSFSINIDSKDYKAAKLELEYGPQIYELNETNQEYYNQEILKPAIVDNIKAVLGL